MTRIGKTLVRETEVFDRSDRVVIEIDGRTITLRLKGKRGPALSVSIEALYQRLCRDQADRERQMQLIARKASAAARRASFLPARRADFSS